MAGVATEITTHDASGAAVASLITTNKTLVPSAGGGGGEVRVLVRFFGTPESANAERASVHHTGVLSIETDAAVYRPFRDHAKLCFVANVGLQGGASPCLARYMAVDKVWECVESRQIDNVAPGLRSLSSPNAEILCGFTDQFSMYSIIERPGLSRGEVAGIVISALALIIIVAAIAVLCVLKKRKPQQQQQQHHQAASQPKSPRAESVVEENQQPPEKKKKKRSSKGTKKTHRASSSNKGDLMRTHFQAEMPAVSSRD